MRCVESFQLIHQVLLVSLLRLFRHLSPFPTYQSLQAPVPLPYSSEPFPYSSVSSGTCALSLLICALSLRIAFPCSSQTRHATQAPVPFSNSCDSGAGALLLRRRLLRCQCYSGAGALSLLTVPFPRYSGAGALSLLICTLFLLISQPLIFSPTHYHTGNDSDRAASPFQFSPFIRIDGGKGANE